jgi:hypothetical protein
MEIPPYALSGYQKFIRAARKAPANLAGEGARFL